MLFAFVLAVVGAVVLGTHEVVFRVRDHAPARADARVHVH